MKPICSACILWLLVAFSVSVQAAGKPVPAPAAPAPKPEASTAPAATPADVRIIPMNNPKQPFEMAAKLQWNPQDKHWDKVLVVYNGHPPAPADHPVWEYLRSLPVPQRQPSKPGENMGYKPFRLNAYCDGTTPLASGKPIRVSFDQNQRGAYSEKDYLRDWNCPKWGMGLNNLAIVNGKESRTGKDQTLRINLLKGLSGCDTTESCINWKPKMGAQLDTMYYSYWVKFPENFDFVMGGKLPGIANDNASTGGGKPNGRDGWSVRVMWNRQGQLGQYVYHMDQPKHFGDFFQWNMPPIAKGQWFQIKTFVKLNTAGKRDGMIKTWVNRQEVLNQQNLRFRLGDDLKIERFLFSVFYGGSGPEWAPSHDMQIYLDEFVLSATDY